MISKNLIKNENFFLPFRTFSNFYFFLFICSCSGIIPSRISSFLFIHNIFIFISSFQSLSTFCQLAIDTNYGLCSTLRRNKKRIKSHMNIIDEWNRIWNEKKIVIATRENNQLLFLTLKQFSSASERRDGRIIDGIVIWCQVLLLIETMNRMTIQKKWIMSFENCVYGYRSGLKELKWKRKKEFNVKLAMNDRWWMWKSRWIDWSGCWIFNFFWNLKGRWKF